MGDKGMKSFKEILLPSKALYEKITSKKTMLIFGIVLIGFNDLIISVFEKGWGKVFIDKSPSNLAFNIGLLAFAVFVIGAVDMVFFAKPLSDLLFGMNISNNFAYKLSIRISSADKDVDKDYRDTDKDSSSTDKDTDKDADKDVAKDADKDVAKNAGNDNNADRENEGIKHIGDRNELAEKLRINKWEAMIKFMKVYAGTHFVILPINLAIYFAFRGLTENSSSTLIIAYVFFDIFTLLWFTGIIAKGANVVFKLESLFKHISYLVIFVWSYILGFALNYMISNWVVAFLK
jgi:hypothetical protein